MGASVIKWIADDGTPFDTQKEMIVYELALLDSKDIDLFLEIQKTSPKKFPEYKKLLVAWQTHMRTQSFAEPLSTGLADPQLDFNDVLDAINDPVDDASVVDNVLKIAEGAGYWPDTVEDVGLKAVVQ